MNQTEEYLNEYNDTYYLADYSNCNYSRYSNPDAYYDQNLEPNEIDTLNSYQYTQAHNENYTIENDMQHVNSNDNVNVCITETKETPT